MLVSDGETSVAEQELDSRFFQVNVFISERLCSEIEQFVKCSMLKKLQIALL